MSALTGLAFQGKVLIEVKRAYLCLQALTSSPKITPSPFKNSSTLPKNVLSGAGSLGINLQIPHPSLPSYLPRD